MPAATTLSRSALNDVYSAYSAAIKTFLERSCPQHLSLVLDMWTDSFKRRSYINVRILFCLKFEIECITLKTEVFPHPHNKYTISSNIRETLCDFGLEKKDIVVVSDGGSNIVAAMKLANMKRLGCTSHALHRLIVHDILQHKNLTVFLNTVKKLKEIFRCLNYNTENIIKIQNVFSDENVFNFLTEVTDIYNIVEVENQFQSVEELEIPENVFNNQSIGTLKNSNDTRWNSLATMFRSFCKNHKVVNIALVEINKTDLALNAMKKNLMQEFLQFLEIFEDATKYLQGRKYPTICSNIVFFEKISDTIEENSSKVLFGESIQMYSYAAECFKKRFKIHKIHLVAALLDPIQKNWKRLDSWLKKVPSNKKMDLFDVLSEDDVLGGISKIDIIFNEVSQLNEIIPDEIPTTSTIAKKQVSNSKLKVCVYFNEPLTETTSKCNSKQYSIIYSCH